MDARAKGVVRNAFAIYLAWVAATYLLEGLPGTLIRPEVVSLRLAYALIVNLGLGILLPLWFIRRLARTRWGAAEDFGFSGPDRTFLSVAAGTAVGAALFAFSQTERIHPVVLLNSFAQVWVVSVAEIVTCWALVGATVLVTLRGWSRPGAYVVAALTTSVLFGVYHFAHSAPFNEPRMVAFLTAIGLATSVWWFASRDVYGTAIFHNFFGVTGVLGTLTANGLVPEHPQPAVPLIVTAVVVALAVLIPGLALRRSARLAPTAV